MLVNRPRVSTCASTVCRLSLLPVLSLLLALAVALNAVFTIQYPMLSTGDIVSLSYHDDEPMVARIDEVNDTHATMTHPYVAFAKDADVLIMKGEFQCIGMVITNRPNSTKAHLPHGRALHHSSHHHSSSSSRRSSRTGRAGCSPSNEACS